MTKLEQLTQEALYNFYDEIRGNYDAGLMDEEAYKGHETAICEVLHRIFMSTLNVGTNPITYKVRQWDGDNEVIITRDDYDQWLEMVRIFRKMKYGRIYITSEN